MRVSPRTSASSDRGIDGADQEKAVVNHGLLVLVDARPVEHVPERPAEKPPAVDVFLCAVEVADHRRVGLAEKLLVAGGPVIVPGRKFPTGSSRPAGGTSQQEGVWQPATG